jgi:salicylate hydroxylase
MLPFMARGGSQTIEDAWVLARCLAHVPDNLAGGLKRCVALRSGRASALQRVSREMGQNVQLQDPDEVQTRNNRMKAAGSAYAERYDWIWGFDVDQA